MTWRELPQGSGLQPNRPVVALVELLKHDLGLKGNGRLDIWLSGALARPFVLPPLAGLKTCAEAVRVAQAKASDATGLPGDSTVWLDRWKPGQACVAVAMQRELSEALLALKRANGFAVKQIRPWWSAVQHAIASMPAMGQPEMLAIRESDSLVCLGANGGNSWAQSYAGVMDELLVQSTLHRLGFARQIDVTRVARAAWSEPSQSTNGIDHSWTQGGLPVHIDSGAARVGALNWERIA